MVVLGRRVFPRGPDMRRLEQYRLYLSGTNVEVAVPRSNFVASKPSEPFEQNHNLNDLPYLKERGAETHIPEHVYFVSRYLKYYGVPLLRGFIGSIDIKVMVLRLPEFSSLFRPRRFECAIERAIYSMMDFGTGESRLDWKIATLNESTWVNYKYKSYASAAEISRYILGKVEDDTTCGSVWSRPISDEHLLAVNFRGKFLGNTDTMCDAFNELERSVMGSVKLELSGDAKRQKGAVRCVYPHENLAAHLPPYKFETYPTLNEFEIADRVSEDLGHNFNLGSDRFQRLCDAAALEQQAKVEEVRKRVLASHLRFEDLEQEEQASMNCAERGRPGVPTWLCGFSS